MYVYDGTIFIETLVRLMYSISVGFRDARVDKNENTHTDKSIVLIQWIIFFLHDYYVNASI